MFMALELFLPFSGIACSIWFVGNPNFTKMQLICQKNNNTYWV
jgi:hypothetical protein